MNDYKALVNRGTSDYKSIFAPGSEMLVEDGAGVAITGSTGDTKQLKWRIWIPPGTRCLQATIYTYSNEVEAKVLMRMHQPPVGGLSNVTPENSAAVNLSTVLSSLLKGAEIPCSSPGFAGNVKLSNGSMDSAVVTTEGGWLYINTLQVPAQTIYKLDVRVSVDKAQYLAWYERAVWDDEGNPVAGALKPVLTYEQKVLQRTIDTGLAAALQTLSGIKEETPFIQAVIDSGVWAALLAFAKDDGNV